LVHEHRQQNGRWIIDNKENSEPIQTPIISIFRLQTVSAITVEDNKIRQYQSILSTRIKTCLHNTHLNLSDLKLTPEQTFRKHYKIRTNSIITLRPIEEEIACLKLIER
jgi:hypothetical protein